MTQPVRRFGDFLNVIGVIVIFATAGLVWMLNDRVNTEGTENRVVARQQTKAIDKLSENVFVASERSVVAAIKIEALQDAMIDVLKRIDRLEQRQLIGRTPQEPPR